MTEGTDANFTATATYNAHGGSGGHGVIPAPSVPIELQQLQLAGVGVPIGTPSANWVTIDTQTTDANGEASFVFDTTGLGGSTIGFRARPQPSNGVMTGGPSPAFDLEILQSCTGVEIGATLAAGNGTPPPGFSGSWTFRIEVHNCDLDTRIFKVQGGTNGWAPMTAAVVSEGIYSVRGNNRNQVLTWWVELDPGEVQYIDVTVTGTIKPSTPDGTILYLSGAWSAAYIDDLGFPAKSDYTGRVSITVTNP